MENIGGYEIIELLGKGGMGRVYSAVHPSHGGLVAIKVLDDEVSSDPGFRKRFEREAQMLASLSHPNIVTIIDSGTTAEGRLWIATKLIHGKDAYSLVRDSGPLPGPVVAEVIRQVASGLDYAWDVERIAHRDVKPSNLIIQDVDTNPGVTIIDFGIAKSHGETTDITNHGQWLGTVSYVSPEVQAGYSSGDNRSDVFSLAVTTYYLLTQRKPFKSPVAHVPLSDLLQGVPDSVEEIFSRALSHDPDQRPTASEFAAVLRDGLRSPTQLRYQLALAAPGAVDPHHGATRVSEAAIDGPPTVPSQTSRSDTPPREAEKEGRSKKRKSVIAAAVAAAVAAVAAGGVLGFRALDDGPSGVVETSAQEILKFDLTNQKLVDSEKQVNGSLDATPLFQYRPQRMLVQQGQQAPENFDGGYGPAKCGPGPGWKQRGITLYTVTPNDKEVTNAAVMQDRELYEDVLIQEFFVFDSPSAAKGYLNTMKETLRKQCPDVDRTMGGRFPIQIKPAITSESEDRFTADSTVTPSRYDISPEMSGGNGSTGQQWRRVASVDRNIVTITDGAHYITKTAANQIQPTNITVAADLISNYIRKTP